MSQQPPPLPLTEPPPLPLQEDEDLLSFTDPPPLPLQPSFAAQEIVPAPIPSPPKEGRLNPNITFLLGIWVGIGLCSVAFCFLAISGRFEPVVRWVQKTAKDLESSEPTSPIAEKEIEATTPDKPEPEAAEKPKADSEQPKVLTDP